jgi:alcohol dehydrogenase class IV
LDAGKAIAAMVGVEGSVQEYLEGVGSKPPPGVTVPLYAVPTTSGTGSEATKNAVISRIGKNGFKKSLRHDNYIPARACIDPALIVGCPLPVTRYAGLDAITQLLEAYVSSGASNVSDLFALEGLRLAGSAFPALAGGEEGEDLRGAMGLAAYYSGIALANAGLGVVHGLASPIGALFPAPHGAVCGSLVAEATRIVIDKLEQGEAAGEDNMRHGLERYTNAAVAISGENRGNPAENRQGLIECLAEWVELCDVPRLSEFGISADSLPEIAAASGTKSTPVSLDEKAIGEILKSRI